MIYPSQIIELAESYFVKRQDPAIVQKYARYFKAGQYNAFGVAKSDINALKDDILRDYSELSMPQIMALGLDLLKHGKHEMGTLAIYLVEARALDFEYSTFALFKEWFDSGVANWEHADRLCQFVLPRFFSQKLIHYTDFTSWIKAANAWTRRAAPVSMIKIKKELELADMLAFTEHLLTDSERVVQQGMGWFLRELWWIHPTEIEDYLYLHRNTAARTIIQYATERLSPAQRLRFRKDKKA